MLGDIGMENKETHSEKALIAQVAKGNELAFKQVFDQYRAIVYTLALRMLKSRTLAEEMVQEVFIKIWEKREGLDQVDNFKGYLYRIAKNRVFDEFKRIAREAISDEVPDENRLASSNNTDYPIRKEQLDSLLEQTLDKLPEQQQYIFKLSREEGLTYREIAEIVNLSPFTVKTHMKNTLAFLRNHMSGYMEFYMLLVLCSLPSTFMVYFFI
ncbi:RNA polymerase sigma-70 factor [Muricauda sp. JGD-17]|uniref:RNA polymerase sigma-70 factor n=1 Tax=Flagellimonas ochracea TaxID=2696472 RepID=A0A964TAS9_9FLAO|nr:RNA polymerase sigma-70 factor [Allomuricauda ochracea]NAY91427.1 RNA polymerase sigma-70 factor [Allomuricauda ochracea]